MLSLGLAGRLEQFRVHETRLESVADCVADTIRSSYPDLRIPLHSRWRHFDTPTLGRWQRLSQRLSRLPIEERARVSIDLAVTSVLLDAGAGPRWRYRDPHTRDMHARSEGLALASFDLFAAGGFSSRGDDPWRADADRLQTLGADELAGAFQVCERNPLVGLEGRIELLRGLGGALRSSPELFGADARAGNLYDYYASRARGGRLSARIVLDALLEGLAPIWPGRLSLHGENLGDVWRHRAIEREDETNGLVPLHKLPQWLAYSLVEPLEAAGLTVTDQDALTGLAEYRNGGLLVDLGVLEPRDADYAQCAHATGSELVVEWRALTVACLDALLPLVRANLGMDDRSLTLSQLMQGGTWEAGRRVARERRESGGPPIRVVSDGTVF